LLGSGYFLILPWKVWPSNDKVRVVAQLRLPDGRLFEADKDVTIHLPPPGQRPAPPPALPPEPVPVAPPELILPPPRRVVPETSGPSISNKPATYLQPAWHVVEPRPHVPED